LSASSSESKIEKFDFVVSNPPFSVEGYMQNLKNMKIEFGKTFELIKEFNDRDTMIEIVFLERSWQLLKEDGFAFIVLPHNFLSVRRYGKARR
jgi:type I restriction enzyme M protein